MGAGSYANAILMPAFKSNNINFSTVVSSKGVSGFHAARKFGFSSMTTDPESLFEDNETDTVVITTQHDSHAHFVIKV